MTEENLPNSNENKGDTANNDSSNSSDNLSNKHNVSEERSHRNRGRPRRTGGQGNSNKASRSDVGELAKNNSENNTARITKTQSTDLVTDVESTTSVTIDDSADNSLADEAALAEGGIKAIGDKRIINFMGIAKPMAIISGLLVLISIGAIIMNGLNLGLDFTGGVSADVTYEHPVEQTQVAQSLIDNGFKDPVVQYLGTRQELLVRLPPQETNSEGLSEAIEEALNLEGNQADVQSVNIIGSQVGNEVYLNALMAMGLALLCMLIYVAVRFQFKLSVGAVAALFHDVIVTLGVFAVLKLPFDLTVLAAVLALIGYSLNDTIVVYDRIRENFRRVRGLTPSRVIDLSLTETLRRTFMTSMTVLLVVGAMMLLGGEGLFWFSITLFIGLIAGTYSSVYIASAIPLMMGLSRDDFIVTVKPEFEEEVVTFEDRNAPMFEEDA